MAVIAGDLVTRLGVDGRKFQSGLDKARSQTRSFASDVGKIVSGIALYDIGKSAVSGIVDLGVESIKLAATAETAAVQFKVLTGSALEAASVMEKINKFAAETPFESMEITQAAKQLLAFGGSSQTVIGELKTLGELASGMGIPLTELAEIYGKARIQGRLFMEDINQLQGRGINISAELAKEFGNVRQAVEKGQVNFGHLERALKAMTTEGGAFAGMMVEMSKTFDGQMSTLLDNIKAIGRSIGQAILPKLTGMATEINGMLGKFNDMPDKLKFLSKFLEAGFVLAIEAIAVKWESMLKRITEKTLNAFGAMLDGISSGKIDEAMKGVAGLFPEGGSPKALQKAQRDFDALLKQLKPDAANPAAAAAAAPAAPKKAPIDGAQVAGALGDLFVALKPIGAGIEQYIGTKIQEGKIAAGGLMGTFDRWFNGDKKKAEPQLAGAMEKGSQEAYSTIVASMLKSADPTVKAIQTQTKELVKKLKPKDPQQMVAMGAVN